MLAAIEDRLSRAGIDSARTEAEVLACHVLGLTRSDLHLNGSEALTPKLEARINDAASLRAERYPLQYITGECEFYSLPFTVREGVFIPRPETEVLVESVLRAVRRPRALLEVGSGCGVVCVCLARELQPGRVVATDISPAAARVTAENAARHGVRDIIQVVVGDGMDFLRRGGQFDLFVCNPPYVAASEIEGLEPEVRDYEPRAALDGGVDGLEFIRRIVPALPSILMSGALAALEIAPDQTEAVAGMLAGSGVRGIECVRDLCGRNRVITARMP